MTPIGVHTESSFQRHALRLISEFIGYPLSSEHAPTIGYGTSNSGGLSIPRITEYTAETIPAIPDEATFHQVTVPQSNFPFDLFQAIEFWLTDQSNQDAPETAFDPHDRLLKTESLQHRLGHGSVPIVNRYMQLFRHWLNHQLNLEIPKRRARIALTHDVDEPVGPGDLGHSFWLMGASLLAGRPRATAGHIRSLPRRLLHRLRAPEDAHWNFEDIVTLEARYDVRSAFYFASTPWWKQGASPYDVTYDVRSPAFRKAFRKLALGGAEVGLHLSYNARENASLLAAEKRRLETASGQSILGGRHHYWHMSRPFWDTLERHGDAGLEYDTSVGFNDAPGYRLGIAHPFYPWNPESSRSIDVLQIPTVLMDGNLLYDASVSVDEALDQVKLILANLKQAEGTASIDWHVRTSYPGRPDFVRWATVYEGVLQSLMDDDGIDVLTPREILGEKPS